MSVPPHRRSSTQNAASEAPPHATLRRLLTAALGDASGAERALRNALSDSRKLALPSDPSELLAFTRARMLTPLTSVLGPRLALALLHDLATELGLASEPRVTEQISYPRMAPVDPRVAPGVAPTSVAPVSARKPRAVGPRAHARRGVLLVDHDRFGRASLARVLVRDCELTVGDSVGDVKEALLAGPVSVAIVRVDHPDIEAIVEILIDGDDAPTIVARGQSTGSASALLTACGAKGFDVVSFDLRPEELLDHVRRRADEGR